MADAIKSLYGAEQKFKRACDQIVQLNRRLEEMAIRYEKANKDNRRSFRYTLRLRMAVTEGVRNMYYEYASRKADEIASLRRRVLNDTHGDITSTSQSHQNNHGGASDVSSESDMEVDINVFDERTLESDTDSDATL